MAGLTIAALALAGALVLLIADGAPFVDLLVVAGLLVSLAAARATLAVHVDLPDAPAPRRPVLFFNPKSGGGKAERFALADEARARGIEPIELARRRPRGARARGGRARRRRARDGRRRRLAGDRRGDRRRARSALRLRARGHAQPLRARPRRRSRRRRRCARRVRRRRRAQRGPGRGQRARVRQQRLARALRRGRPARGLPRREAAHAARHRPGRARPRRRRARHALDRPGRARTPLGGDGARLQQQIPARPRGRLGHAPADRRRPARDHGRRRAHRARRERPCLQRPLREWSAPAFEVDADRPVPAGIDGEALMLDPPLRFRIRPGVLRVRIARKHPGASPSAQAPEGIRAGAGRAGANRARPAPATATSTTRRPEWT